MKRSPIEPDGVGARLRHGDEAALGHLAPRAHEAQSRPHPHRLRGVGARRGPPLVAQRHRLRGRQPPVVLLVEAHPVGVADDQAGVRLPPPREALSRASCSASRSGGSSASSTRRYRRKPKMASSLRWFSVSSW